MILPHSSSAASTLWNRYLFANAINPHFHEKDVCDYLMFASSLLFRRCSRSASSASRHGAALPGWIEVKLDQLQEIKSVIEKNRERPRSHKT